MTTRSFLRSYLEPEPTGPAGGKMKYELQVEPPDEGSRVVWVRLRETVVDEDGEGDPRAVDQLLLDLPTTRWLYAQLGEAIACAEGLAREAEAREDAADRKVEKEEKGLFVAYFPCVFGRKQYLVERTGSFSRSDLNRTRALSLTMIEWEICLDPARRAHLRFERP